jgi:hypothetical protein
VGNNQYNSVLPGWQRTRDAESNQIFLLLDNATQRSRLRAAKDEIYEPRLIEVRAKTGYEHARLSYAWLDTIELRKLIGCRSTPTGDMAAIANSDAARTA